MVKTRHRKNSWDCPFGGLHWTSPMLKKWAGQMGSLYCRRCGGMVAFWYSQDYRQEETNIQGGLEERQPSWFMVSHQIAAHTRPHSAVLLLHGQVFFPGFWLYFQSFHPGFESHFTVVQVQVCCLIIFHRFCLDFKPHCLAFCDKHWGPRAFQGLFWGI
jgi:hypothetical protein